MLIEPCRKKSRSRRDQVGTWAVSLAADFRKDDWAVGLSGEVAQELKLRKIRKLSAIQIIGVGFISGELFYCPAPFCKASLSFVRGRLGIYFSTKLFVEKGLIPKTSVDSVRSSGFARLAWISRRRGHGGKPCSRVTHWYVAMSMTERSSVAN